MTEERKDWTGGLETGWDADMRQPSKPTAPSANIRFWMPKGQDRNIIFLTDKPKIVFWEHGFKLGSSYKNFATCLSHLGIQCPLCALGIKRYKAAPFTIIDRTEFTLKKGDKAGQVMKDVKRLLVAKADTWELLARKAKTLAERGQRLRGAQYKVFRSSSDKAPSVGSDFEFMDMVDLAKFKDVEEYDYTALFKPDPELVKHYLEALKASGGLDAGGDEPAAFDPEKWNPPDEPEAELDPSGHAAAETVSEPPHEPPHELEPPAPPAPAAPVEERRRSTPFGRR